MPHPKIEVTVTEDLARTLLRRQHPDLADLPLRWVGTGWDNALWRLGDHLALRFPVRESAVPLVIHEQQWLPVLAPHLPVDVPVPVRVGVAGAGYPWPWSVVPWFDSVSAGVTPVEERGAWAEQLADVFVALHRPAPVDAPRNPFRGVPLATRRQAVEHRARTVVPRRAERVLARFDALAAAPTWDGQPLWLHGDPHPANLLVHDGALRAVIDFGDLTSGDPACDLSTAWLTFDADARARFRARVDAGCGWDDAMWRRAQAWALSMSVSLLAHPDEYPELAAMGRHGLAQALAED
ncbi:aminoglycoside phosphotransferase [Cellulomonas chitinilytica]|uniref:Aminoglycoside phosphotransferase n=1 Tax=Cellulomonas chitinilytica TaxID=398759 RepID=A0A919NZE8_9CELL|nr:aminoglycoside phosphotransferase family protein [Cellulomonas chitinilytica]GIG20501.1 aminoglycoside phosphotransferase [Cellulomonas chitinilytica]